MGWYEDEAKIYNGKCCKTGLKEKNDTCTNCQYTNQCKLFSVDNNNISAKFQFIKDNAKSTNYFSNIHPTIKE